MNDVLLTGATGFLGKMTLLTLLEDDNVGRVFVLVRAKDGETIAERFDKVFVKNPMFQSHAATLRQRVIPLQGDQQDAFCGLSADDQAQLHGSVQTIINCVASIRFNLAINRAYISNVKTLLNLLEVAQQCTNLQHFVHTSTAYVAASKSADDLQVDVPCEFRTELDQYFAQIDKEGVSEAILEASDFPNSYTFTKAMAEYKLRQIDLPFAVSVVRPSIIASSHNTPFPGWVESEAGYLAYVKGILGGGIPMLHLNRKNRLNVVPVDHVARVLVDVAMETREPGKYYADFATSAPEWSPTLIEKHVVFRHIFRTISRKEIKHLPIYLPYRWLFNLILRVHTKTPRLVQAYYLRQQGKKIEAKRHKRQGSINEQLYAQYRYFLNQRFRFHDDRAYTYLPSERPDLYHSIIIRSFLQKTGIRKDGYETFAGSALQTRHGDLHFCMSASGWIVPKRLLGLWFLRLTRKVFNRVEVNIEQLVAALSSAPKGSCIVLVPTHKSYFDFLFLYFLLFAFPELKIYGMRTAAAELFSNVPVFAWVMRQLDVFFVQRDPTKDSIRSLRDAAKTISKPDLPFMFFPEGRRSRSGKLLPIKRGMFRFLKEAPNHNGFHIIPLAFGYESRPDEQSLLSELNGGGRSRVSFKRGFLWYMKALVGKVRCGNVSINIGEPLHMDGETSLPDLEERLSAQYNSLEKALEKRIPPVVRLADHLVSKDSSAVNDQAIAS